ncbi:hypothetical protein IWGMT90018_38840 [Mycobacterium kiyosense]|nr:hypothetical protein IWGMT90018_38840 [Mycobacterium kiyosense]
MADTFCPNVLVAVSCVNRALLAATSAGGTVARNAVSKAAADARACSPANARQSAVQLSQTEKGCAAAAIARAAGLSHSSVVSLVITASKSDAAALNSAATPFHAAPAASIGAAPAPAYISAELTSGGSAPKSNLYPFSGGPWYRRSRPTGRLSDQAHRRYACARRTPHSLPDRSQ